METGYNYAILCHNRADLEHEKTLLDSKYLKSKKYALICKVVNKDHSELISHIHYSNDLSATIDKMKRFYISWYDQITGLKKDIQGNVSEY